MSRKSAKRISRQSNATAVTRRIPGRFREGKYHLVVLLDSQKQEADQHEYVHETTVTHRDGVPVVAASYLRYMFCECGSSETFVLELWGMRESPSDGGK